VGHREINPAVLEADSNFWYNRDGLQSEYITAIAALASRFKNDSTVIGYSFFNEPWPGWNLPPGFEDLLLFPFYRRAIDALTGIHDGAPCPTQIFMPAICGFPDLGVDDLRHMFFMEPGLLREITDFPTHLGLPVSSSPNLVLSIHAYTHVYTLDTLLPLGPASYPWGGYEQSYALASREATAIGAALFVSEFGNPPGQDTLLTNQLLEQEKYRVSWAFWDWKENCDGWGMYKGDSCSAGDTAPRRQNGCLRTSREQLLARVYPRASADPNLTFRYEPATGAFLLNANGKSGEPATVVYLPPEVTGSVEVSGHAADPQVYTYPDGSRIASVAPSDGDYSVSVTPSALNLRPCV
jgi:hypothetical protein